MTIKKGKFLYNTELPDHKPCMGDDGTYICRTNPSSDGKIMFIVNINHTNISTLQIKSRDIQNGKKVSDRDYS